MVRSIILVVQTTFLISMQDISPKEVAYTRSFHLAGYLRAAGYPVLLAFDDPGPSSLIEVFEKNISPETDRVVVLAPVVSGQNGQLFEAVERAREACSANPLVYIWRFECSQVGQTFAEQIRAFFGEESAEWIG